MGFFCVLVILSHVITHIIGLMLASTLVKLLVYMSKGKHEPTTLPARKEQKCLALTSFFLLSAWLLAAGLLSSVHPSLSYAESFYCVLGDMLTVGFHSYLDDSKTPWMEINQNPLLFTLSFLLYYVQMSLVALLFKTVVDAVVTKRSGLCCVALLGNETKSYEVTCPKCLMVEMEMEQIKRTRQLQQSVA